MFDHFRIIFDQEAMRNLRKFTDDSAWLEDNLHELLQDAPDADAKRERERLSALLARFNHLQPRVKEAGDKSKLLSKCYEFRDHIGGRSSWLDDYQKQVLEQPYVDGLQEAKMYLQEHEVSGDTL